MLTRRQTLKAICAAAVAAVTPIPAMGAAEVVPAPRFDCCDPSYPSMTVTFPGGTCVLYLQPDGSYQSKDPDGVQLRVSGVGNAYEACPL